MLRGTSIIATSRNGEDITSIKGDAKEEDSTEDKIGELENKILLSNANNNTEELLEN